MKKVSFGELFWLFFKIGAFTFGGGYAMIALITKEIVEKRKWISDADFLDLIAIAESTPGPIAINSATYLGFKLRGFWGSFFATLGVVIPSFLVIVGISFVIEPFRELVWVDYAFKGIAAGVSVLIINAGLKLFKGVEKDWFSFGLMALGFLLALLDLVPVPFVILGGGLLGFLRQFLKKPKEAEKR